MVGRPSHTQLHISHSELVRRTRLSAVFSSSCFLFSEQRHKTESLAIYLLLRGVWRVKLPTLSSDIFPRGRGTCRGEQDADRYDCNPETLRPSMALTLSQTLFYLVPSGSRDDITSAVVEHLERSHWFSTHTNHQLTLESSISLPFSNQTRFPHPAPEQPYSS